MQIYLSIMPIDSKKFKWPEGWPIPRIDETVIGRDGRSFKVTCVEYHPLGEEDADDAPFVYVDLKAVV